METTTGTTTQYGHFPPWNALCQNHGLCIDCIKVALFFPRRLSTELPPHTHTHTNTNTEFRCWLSLTAKRQQKQQRFETLSVSIDLDATGRWLSINAQIGCFEALHQEIPSSEKFIHRPGKQPPSGSTNRQSENSQKKNKE